MKVQISLLAILSLCLSCKDTQESIPDAEGELIFGEAYGFCVGDCAHFYRLSNGNLYQDTIDRYMEESPEFDDTPLTSAQYELAAPLLSGIPDYLLKNTNQTIGCPDCADQGGVHLFLTNESQSLFWHIDTFTENQPEEIRAYVSQVRSIIDQLRN